MVYLDFLRSLRQLVLRQSNPAALASATSSGHALNTNTQRTFAWWRLLSLMEVPSSSQQDKIGFIH